MNYVYELSSSIYTYCNTIVFHYHNDFKESCRSNQLSEASRSSNQRTKTCSKAQEPLTTRTAACKGKNLSLKYHAYIRIRN